MKPTSPLTFTHALRHSLTALALAALLSGAAHAQVSVQFTPDTQTILQGGTANYTALFTNLTNTDYFVTLGVYNPDVPGGSGLIDGLFNGDPANGNAPFAVFGGKTVTITSVFTLLPDPSLGNGTYTGTVDFQGLTAADFRAGTGSETILGSAPLTLQIGSSGPAPVPEASTTVSLTLMLALGAGSLMLARRRRVRA